MISEDFGVCLRLLSFYPDRSLYDDIMIGSEPSLYACTSPSLVRTPFDEDLSDPPSFLSPYNLMTNVDWLDTRKVRGIFPQGLTQSRIVGMRGKSFYDEEYSPSPLSTMKIISPENYYFVTPTHRIRSFAHELSSYIRQIKWDVKRKYQRKYKYEYDSTYKHCFSHLHRFILPICVYHILQFAFILYIHYIICHNL